MDYVDPNEAPGLRHARDPVTLSTYQRVPTPLKPSYCGRWYLLSSQTQHLYPVNSPKHYIREINYDSPRGGVSVITEKGDVTTSYLLIQRASQADSGNYTCNPSNANAKTVHVHVLNGEVPAAMQRACPGHIVHPVTLVLILGLTVMSR
ncbi:hypothetical protein WDU94_014756 [Cyamophila willieti]